MLERFCSSLIFFNFSLIKIDRIWLFSKEISNESHSIARKMIRLVPGIHTFSTNLNNARSDRAIQFREL